MRTLRRAGTGGIILLAMFILISLLMVAFGAPAQADTVSQCYSAGLHLNGAMCWVTPDWWSYWFAGANAHWQFFPGWQVT